MCDAKLCLLFRFIRFENTNEEEECAGVSIIQKFKAIKEQNCENFPKMAFCQNSCSLFDHRKIL